MTAAVRYLDLADVLILAEGQTGVDAVTLQRTCPLERIEAALMAPSAALDEHERHPTLAGKAAALGTRLIATRALPSHNQHVAWLAMREFVSRNGAAWETGDSPPREVAAMLDAVAAGDMGVGQLTAWLEERVRIPQEAADGH